MDTKITIALRQGHVRCDIASLKLRLDRYKPEADIDEVNEEVQKYLDLGNIEIKSKPSEETELDEAGDVTQPADEDIEGAAPAEKKVTLPTGTEPCAAKNKAGKKCKRKAIVGSEFCPAHIPDEERARLEAEQTNAETGG